MLNLKTWVIRVCKFEEFLSEEWYVPLFELLSLSSCLNLFRLARLLPISIIMNSASKTFSTSRGGTSTLTISSEISQSLVSDGVPTESSLRGILCPQI